MVRRAGIGRAGRWILPFALWAFVGVGPADAQSGADPELPDVESIPVFLRLGSGTRGLVGGDLGGVAFPRDLRPLSTHRWDKLVRQELDAGCGPASLATIYTHYLDIPVSEEEMSKALTAQALRRGRTARDIQTRGYSLADLKRVAEHGRLITAAFRAEIDNLLNLKIPVVTHVSIRGYGHFVVIRGMVDDRVVVADPNFGNMTYPIGQFGKIWSGLLLAIGRPKGTVSEAALDATIVPTIQEIDYETFQRNGALPSLPLPRLGMTEARLEVRLGTLLPGSSDLTVLTFDTFVTEFNND